jgi:hypothetical protein
VLKFDKTGKFLMQIGKAGKTEGSDSQTGFNRPSGVAVDSAANELYVADGFGNHRIAVFNATTGAFKRSWGAYGEKPTDTDPGAYDPNAAPSKQFHTVSCVKIAKDGMVYVCDRQNDRIQVFQKDGKFVKEGFVSKTTTGDGSVWDVAFSPDQRLLYVADGHDKKVWILDRSSSKRSAASRRRALPGSFLRRRRRRRSKSNVYTGETYEGKRVQKFVKSDSVHAPENTKHKKHETHEVRLSCFSCFRAFVTVAADILTVIRPHETKSLSDRCSSRFWPHSASVSLLGEEGRRAGEEQQDHDPAIRSGSDVPQAAAESLV